MSRSAYMQFSHLTIVFDNVAWVPHSPIIDVIRPQFPCYCHTLFGALLLIAMKLRWEWAAWAYEPQTENEYDDTATGRWEHMICSELARCASVWCMRVWRFATATSPQEEQMEVSTETFPVKK